MLIAPALRQDAGATANVKLAGFIMVKEESCLFAKENKT